MLHGFQGDPRYPSPRKLRRAIAFAIDFVIHIGAAVGMGFAAERVPALSHLVGLWAIAAWLMVSFVHRVIIQRLTHTTLGKAFFGLCLIRPADGGPPRFGQLVKAWLAGILAGISVVGEIAGSAGDVSSDLDKVFLPAVRSRDVRALRDQWSRANYGNTFR